MESSTEFNVKGKWFLPNNELSFCYGELSYSFDQGIKLVIYGSLFGTTNIFESKSNLIVDTIYGKTMDGRCITLIQAYANEVGSNEILETKFSIDFASISSSYFLTLNTDVFDKISIHLNCNEAFFANLFTPIKVDKVDNEHESNSFSHHKTLPIEIYKDENINSYLFFSYRFRLSHSEVNELEFSQKVFFNVEFSTANSFKECINYSENLKTLFSFFSTAKIFHTILQIREKDTQEYFKIIYHQGNKNSIKKLTRSDLLIQHDEIAAEFNLIFKWWINNIEFVSYGLSLYREIIYSGTFNPIQHLINIVFALETLHVTFFDKKIFTDDVYATFKNQKQKFILDDLFKDRLNQCLNNFNELSFKSRLLDLLKQNEEILNAYIKNPNQFCNMVRNQRNYFAHKHSQTRTNLIPIEKLDFYFYMCKLIFDVSFLKLIGLKDSQIKIILKRDFYLSYYASKEY